MAKAQRFDAAEYLDSSEDIAEYLSEAFATRDTEFIVKAIGTIARAQGMAEVARRTGLNRESLYRALNAGGNPELDTLMKVLNVLGVQLATKPKAQEARAAVVG